MVQHWQALAPSESILVCDSYFGSANTAAYLTSAGQPFVLLAKRNDHGVGELGANLREGEEECAVASELPFALHCFKNPKVGGKAARVVPMYTNCSVDPALWQHPRGHWLPPLSGAYRSLAAGVDQANALALHFREIKRFPTWSRALHMRAFVLRYGVVNTINTCKDLCLVPEETSLWDFQRMLLDDFFPEERFAKKEVHCIRATVKRGVCAYCKTGRVAWVCAACRVPLHMHPVFCTLPWSVDRHRDNRSAAQRCSWVRTQGSMRRKRTIRGKRVENVHPGFASTRLFASPPRKRKERGKRKKTYKTLGT